jgi:hypothetical protein
VEFEFVAAIDPKKVSDGGACVLWYSRS